MVGTETFLQTKLQNTWINSQLSFYFRNNNHPWGQLLRVPSVYSHNWYLCKVRCLEALSNSWNIPIRGWWWSRANDDNHGAQRMRSSRVELSWQVSLLVMFTSNNSAWMKHCNYRALKGRGNSVIIGEMSWIYIKNVHNSYIYFYIIFLLLFIIVLILNC